MHTSVSPDLCVALHSPNFVCTLQAAGFKSVATISRGYPYLDLWAVASKEALAEEQMKALAIEHITPV